MLKRTFDIFAATIGLLCAAPIMLASAIAIRCTSPGPILFRQERVGKNFEVFQILKFRTMYVDASQRGGPLTQGHYDPRITPVGSFLRRWKIDELPQLVNVLSGRMSLVGPRPEVPKYVAMFRDDYSEILRVRPGITDAASLKYRDEASLLGAASDAETEYVARILPDKIAIAKAYLRQGSFASDLVILARTVLGV